MFRLSTDERTAEAGRRLLADGTCVVTPAVWHGRAVQRCAVSNWSTTEADVDRHRRRRTPRGRRTRWSRRLR